MRKVVIAALTTSVLLVMGVVRVMDLQWSRGETLKVAEARAANLALILSEYISNAFDAGDAALRQLAIHSRRIGGPTVSNAEWAPSLATARAGLTGIGAISIVDRDFVVRHSTRPEIVGQTRTDETFQRALAAPGDNLIIGPPFKAVVAPGGFLFPIGRRLTTRDGATDGAVVASFIPEELREFFQQVDVGARGAVWVLHPSGVILFREPSTNNPIGESALGNPIFETARANRSGTLRAAIVEGGPEMVSAFHTADAPLIVAVSLDSTEVLAAWRREAIESIAIFAVVTLLLVTTLLVLFRQMDHRAAAETALARAREAEAEHLRQANERLAETVEREQSARRDAEAASALKDQFLMTVSHELRTPLTAIAGWARLLVDGMVGDDRRETALRTIERNAQVQKVLVEDLLDVSSIISGKLRLDVRSVSIVEVVKNAIEAVAPAIDAKALRLVTTLDPDAGRISGDPDRLQQIVWNLLSNAVKFTPTGGRVDVSVVRDSDEIEIVVADSGAGIAPDFLPHVFERFRQESAGTSRRTGGLGLGLAIVGNLVELHGGRITAASDGEGRGARFVVRLPAAISKPLRLSLNERVQG
jgi:signal transduction histidine kinase